MCFIQMADQFRQARSTEITFGANEGRAIAVDGSIHHHDLSQGDVSLTDLKDTKSKVMP